MVSKKISKLYRISKNKDDSPLLLKYPYISLRDEKRLEGMTTGFSYHTPSTKPDTIPTEHYSRREYKRKKCES